MIENLGTAASCTVGDILQFAELNDLVITTNSEFIKTVAAVFVIGAVVGIVSWEIFKYMRAYGKRHARENN